MDNQNDVEALGWDAIDNALSPVYGKQEPLHYGTLIKFALGGPDPIDGVSVYRSDNGLPHWHYVSYVFSSGNVFEHGHYVDCNGPIALGTDTQLLAVIFVEDPELKSIDTPHGK